MSFGSKNKGPLWVHVGIPSHGSSALRQVLMKAFPEPGTVIDPSTADPSALDNAHCALMHANILPLHTETSRECCYFTFLRDPFNAFISDFFWNLTLKHYALRGLTEDLSDGLKSFSMTLEDYVAGLPRSLNLAARLIRAVEHRDPLASRKLPNFLTMKEFFAPIADDELLEQAIEIFDKRFFMVGITELFEDSLFVISNFLGIPEIPLWERTNAAIRPQGWSNELIAPAQRQRILQATAVDRKLHAILSKSLVASKAFRDIDQETLNPYRTVCRQADAENMKKFNRDGARIMNEELKSLKAALSPGEP